MTRMPTRRWLVLALPLLCASTLSCRGTRTTRPYHEPPPPDIRPTVLDYVETDAFDRIFESALVNQDPVILVQTDTSQPDWGPRLNAWIAAWNRGGKVAEAPRRRARMQAPLPTVNADTIREFRLLIDDLMKRVDDLALRGSSWWAEERTQRRRIALLKPYSLRFHLDEDKKIRLIFFNGEYSRHYREIMDALALRDEDGSDQWCRDMKCSACKERLRGITTQRTHERASYEEHSGEE